MAAVTSAAPALVAVGMLLACCCGPAFTAGPSVKRPAASAIGFRLRGGLSYSELADARVADSAVGEEPAVHAAALGAVIAGAVAIASSRRRSQQLRKKGGAQLSAEAVCSLMTATPAPARVVLASGGFVPQVRGSSERASLVARKSRNSCRSLYFTQAMPDDRKRRNLRNRAYNIFMRNRYKRQMKRVLAWAIELEYGDMEFPSKEEALAAIKPMLDKACKTIDFVSTQGVLHRVASGNRKERMCRNILRGMISKGWVSVTPEERAFTPAYKLIGYEMPKTQFTREPRPWHLPGWKSPWMLKREFDKWQKQRAK